MHGNVWEWCHDGGRDATDEAITDPVGETNGERAVRGGAWFNDHDYCRCTTRYLCHVSLSNNVVGFRIFCLADGI